MGNGINLKEIRKITAFCRKNGIIVFRCSGFEFRIAQKALRLPKPKIQKVDVPIAGMPSQQDLLLWSSTPQGYEMPGPA